MNIKFLKKNKKGFALLFSVLVSSLLLTIGLSIFNIALKELAISRASRQSIYAFYAADSGREYVLYRDTNVGDMLPFDFDRESTYSISAFTNSNNITFVKGTDGPNYKVTITKSWHDDNNNPRSKVDTTIKATGWDSVGGDRVERAITETY
jgi:Tfp pilus assembly protein PilV